MSMTGGHKNGKSVKKYGVNTLIVRRWWTNMQFLLHKMNKNASHIQKSCRKCHFAI